MLENETVFVFATVFLAAVLFASGKVRLDFVALLVVLALALSGVLTPSEALAGFGDPVVLLVAGLMVLGESLDRTGVAQSIGTRIAYAGGSSRFKLLTMMMLVAAGLSSIMSSTAVVAIFIPILFRISKRTGISVSRLLMPMSFAAMISGMLTLIATPPNLVVSDALKNAGHEPLSFFGFAPVGIVVLALSILVMLTWGDRILKKNSPSVQASVARSIQDLWQDFAFDKKLESLHVSPHSSLCGKTLAENQLESRYSIRVLRLTRGRSENGDDVLRDADPRDLIRPGATLRVVGDGEKIAQFMRQENLQISTYPDALRRRFLQERGAGVVMIHPECRFVGKSIRQSNLRSRFGVHVIGMRRDGQGIASFGDTPLKAADLLLVVGPWERISALAREHHDFVLLELPAEHTDARPAFRRAPVALLILMAMVLLSMSGIAPVSIIVLAAAVATVVCGCMTTADAYRAISWSSLVLLAGMLPVADALAKTGGIELIVSAVTDAVGDAGPRAMMSLLFALSAGLSLFLSNTATAVLLAPVAIRVAETMDVSAYPLAISVLIGASSAFASPVASPVVTLVVEPGHYRFGDFVKAGGPLMLLAFLANLLITPLLYPL